MALDQLGQFMWAIGAQESGNNYDAVGPYTGPTYGRARGRWQIMERIYPSWAREAGVDPNDYSPAAQDKVASYKMKQYYQRYGRWDLVAIAWFAGPGRADKAARDGIQSVGGLSDVLGTTVTKYVQKLQQGMAQAPNATQAGGYRESGGGRTEGTGPTAPMAGSTSPEGMMATGGLPPQAAAAADPNVRRQRESTLNQETIEQIMGAVSSAASAGGGQLLDIRSMFGDTFTRIKGVE